MYLEKKENRPMTAVLKNMYSNLGIISENHKQDSSVYSKISVWKPPIFPRMKPQQLVLKDSA